MISVSLLCRLLGIVLLISAFRALTNRKQKRRVMTASFWGLYGANFLVGDELSPIIVGSAVFLMAAIAGLGGVQAGKHAFPDDQTRADSARRLGIKLFVPALTIPLMTMVFTLFAHRLVLGGRSIIDPSNTVLLSLGLAVIIALVVTCIITRDNPMQSTVEAHRLIDSFGWPIVLPQVLAILGLLFIRAGVGTSVTHALTPLLEINSKFLTVVVYCLGMMSITMVMGNAFAVFPLMAAGVGIPILITQYGANPAIVAAVGMFSGYCGSLVTPMNATYNIVPVSLLDLGGKYSLIRLQIMTAIPLILFNVLFLYASMTFNF
jgi:uncharacterized membrane protein